FDHGFELWKSNGTEAGTVLVKDIFPGLSGSSGKSANAGDGGDPRRPAWPVAASPSPDERMAVPIPVRRRPLHCITHLFPTLEAPPLQGQRPQHLPPRLDQVQVRRVLRLEDKLPPWVRQRKQQDVRRPVRL